MDYPQAIELFQEVIDNYPYSEYATLSEIKIADVHFEQGNFEEAASYYQDFVELHPTHAQVAYAIYRNGECSFAQLREADQDQTPAKEAMAQFNVLIERYPDSEYAELAKARITEATDQLARHDIEVGHFYLERGEYHAAAMRYRRALESFPEHSSHLHTMIQLGIALKRMHRYDEAESLLQQVLAARPEARVRAG